MLEFIQQIFDYFRLVIHFVINMITSLVKFIAMVPQWQAMLTTTYAFIPDVLLPFAMISIFLGLLYLILPNK